MLYILYMSGMPNLAAGLSALHSSGLVPSWSREVNQFGTFTHRAEAPGVMIEGQYLIESDPRRQEVQATQAIEPALRFLFEVNEFDYDKEGNALGIMTLLRVISQLLTALPDPAVVVSDEGALILQRSAELLLLNTDDGFWNPYRISHIHLPHRLHSLASFSLAQPA